MRLTALIRLLMILLFVLDYSRADAKTLFWYYRPLGDSGYYNNFGDYLSWMIVQRIVPDIKLMSEIPLKDKNKFMALGSIIHFAIDGDVIWGSGINGKHLKKKDYSFEHLDIRAVRGPLTRSFLYHNFGLIAPEIYGDPALLFPYLYPEYKKKKNPSYQYLVIPHADEVSIFPRSKNSNIIYPTDPSDEIIDKILDCKLVISSTLHGIIFAEAFGIPARLLKVTDKEPLFKYEDYYAGTNRPDFKYATSVEEALLMGGERPIECNLEMLFDAFPFDLWPGRVFEKPVFEETIN